MKLNYTNSTKNYSFHQSIGKMLDFIHVWFRIHSEQTDDILISSYLVNQDRQTLRIDQINFNFRSTRNSSQSYQYSAKYCSWFVDNIVLSLYNRTINTNNNDKHNLDTTFTQKSSSSIIETQWKSIDYSECAIRRRTNMEMCCC